MPLSRPLLARDCQLARLGRRRRLVDATAAIREPARRGQSAELGLLPIDVGLPVPPLSDRCRHPSQRRLRYHHRHVWRAARREDVKEGAHGEYLLYMRY